MNVDEWIRQVRIRKNKKAMPVLTFPAVSLMGISVRQLVESVDLQVQALKTVTERTDPLAVMGFMDLSIESEAFGADVRFSEDEIPVVRGILIHDQQELDALQVPEVGIGRTGMAVETIRRTKIEVTDRPVLAGCIGPFSLAGRLLDVTEAMILCYDDPDFVHAVLEKVTEFLIRYISAFKAAGADGIFIAEPLAGIISADLAEEFSNTYVKKIVDAVKDEHFLVAYHNCGNNTLRMYESLFHTGCHLYHFGNAIDMRKMVELMPDSVMVAGNIDPVSLRSGSVESVAQETEALLADIGEYRHFIISTGCDVPPGAKWENIDAFMKVSRDFYLK